jgi:hypothetical protein
MATLKEASGLTSELTELSQELHSELTEGDIDFDRMIALADRISEQADGLADAFSTVNEALRQRITEVKQGGNAGAQSKGDGSQQESRPAKGKSGSRSGAKSGGGS